MRNCLFLVIGLLVLRVNRIVFVLNLHIFGVNRTFLDENPAMFKNVRVILSYGKHS